MKKKIPVLVLVLVLTATLESCVTKKACERKFPPRIITETIIRDTVIHTETTKFDTLFRITREINRDTIFFTDRETQIKIKYLVKNDSIFLSAECPPDTIRVPVEITKTKVVHETTEEKSNRGLWIALLVIAGVLAVGFLIKQLRSIG